MERTFAATSPRQTVHRTPWRSRVIHLGVGATGLALLACTFGAHGIWAWAIGLAYATYDTSLLVFTLLASWRLRRQPAVSRSPSNIRPADSRIGVIVAAHNEASVLAATIAALMQQTQPPHLVLIADDGSSDGTIELMVRHFGLTEPAPGYLSAAGSKTPALRWLRLPHGGKARALNAGIAHIVAEELAIDIVVTVDADTLLDRHALHTIADTFAAQPHVVAATGVLEPVCRPGWQGRMLQGFQTYEYVRNFLTRHAWSRIDSLLLISGAFASFRLQPLLKVGGFDTDCLVEDYELIHRLRRHAAQQGLPWTTTVIGAAHGPTEAPGSVPAFVRQRRRWFGGFLQTQYWYRDMVGDARYGAIGTRLLPVKAIDTVQPFIGLSAWLVLLGNAWVGRTGVVLPALATIGSKAAFDMVAQMWSLHVYRHWTGHQRHGNYALACAVALIEPLSFQVLKNVSAAWGWWLWLTDRLHWGHQSRSAVLTTHASSTTADSLMSRQQASPKAIADRC